MSEGAQRETESTRPGQRTMQRTVCRNALPRNTALQPGPERPVDSALKSKEAVAPGFWRDLSLLGLLFLCLKGRSWILGDTRTESPGGGKMSLQAPVSGGSFFLLPRSSGSLSSCLPPKEENSLDVGFSEAWLFILLLGTKASQPSVPQDNNNLLLADRRLPEDMPVTASVLELPGLHLIL